MNTITYILKEFPGKHIMLENVRSFTMTDAFYKVTFNSGVMIKIKCNRIRSFSAYELNSLNMQGTTRK